MRPATLSLDRLPERLNLKYFTAKNIDDDHQDLVAGLRQRPVSIPSRYSYDDLGSELYEARIRQPEYYQLELEQEILKIVGSDLRELPINVICELGAGSALKISMLIKVMGALDKPLRYCPIDINETVLRAAGAELVANFSSLSVEAFVGTYEQGLASLAEIPGHKLFLFLGSTIGNLEDEEIVRLLRLIGRHCGVRDRLLITADLQKDPMVALKAYCDAAGVGARMEMNVLTHLNRLFDATFDIAKFTYQPIYDHSHNRVEARLVSWCDHYVDLPKLDLGLRFLEGDYIRTDIMRKFPHPDLENTFKEAGCSITRSWTDSKGWYGAFLLGFPNSQTTTT